MSDLESSCIIANDWEALDHIGKQIYQSNPFYRSLCNLMQHPMFKDVFQKHFGSWQDIEVFVLFAKIYEKIACKFPDASPYAKVAMTKKLIDDSSTRSMVCDEIRNWKQGTRSSSSSSALSNSWSSITSIELSDGSESSDKP